MMRIAVLAHDGMTALDDVGPAQVVQLAIEYDPAPPCSAGSPKTAPAAIVDAARRTLSGAAS